MISTLDNLIVALPKGSQIFGSVIYIFALELTHNDHQAQFHGPLDFLIRAFGKQRLA